MDGVLPVYKPVGITSYDVIRAFKRAVHPDFKVGHGGTLDPFADGVLLLLLGKATKWMNELSELPKTYRAVAILGASSDTLDVTGMIVNIPKMQQTKMSKEKIEQAAKKFVGTIEQKIPDYSAAKVNGEPRYKLARQGKVIPTKSKPVTIYNLEIMELRSNECILRTTCSSGTYIRQLSFDIFWSLGVESYLKELTRETVGEYTIDRCCKIDDFISTKWQDKVVPLVLPIHGE